MTIVFIILVIAFFVGLFFFGRKMFKKVPVTPYTKPALSTEPSTVYVDKAGNEISKEEYEKLYPEQKELKD